MQNGSSILIVLYTRAGKAHVSTYSKHYMCILARPAQRLEAWLLLLAAKNLYSYT